MKQLLIILLLSSMSLTAQELSLKECLQMGIESNYGIKIAENNLKVAQNNVTPASFLPSVSVTARQNQDILSNKERPRDNSGDVSKDYTSDLMTADLGVSWTLFDGMGMFATYQTKKELLSVGELNLRNSLEGLVSDISQQYYYVVTQHERVKASKKYLEISTLRYNQAREKYILQTISGLEMTQAKMDFNADSSKLVTQEELLDNGYIQLYELMNIPLGSEYQLTDSITAKGILSREGLIESAKNNSVPILLAKQDETLSDLDLKIARSSRYPILSFGSGYKFNRTANNSSALRFNQTNGVNWGFTLSAKLFDGMEVNRKIKNAKIERESSSLSYNQTILSIESAISQLYNTYQKNFLMINFEAESAVAALTNLEAAVVMYRIGSMSGVEFREIQRSYLEAQERKISAMFQAKVSEISLKLLSGEILIY